MARLDILLTTLAGCSALPGGGSERRQSVVAPTAAFSLPAPRSAEAGQCLGRLGQMGAQYTPVADRYIDQGCAVLGTVQLASLRSDEATLGVTNLGPVTCEVGQAFSAWARFGVDRAARQILGSPVRSIETFGSYSCRNVAGSSRRSGHATGAAIDISGFVLEDGRRIMVKAAWNGGPPASASSSVSCNKAPASVSTPCSARTTMRRTRTTCTSRP